MTLAQITQELIRDLQGLRFGPPVSHVYNPLIYAGEAYARYLTLYGQAPKEVLLLGMNPGPWGMAQTGVPFGEVRLVRDWLKIAAPVGAPAAPHPKRPVTGFACTRSEVSGARLWGWVRETFQTPERFFARFFVANYCPLIFIEAGGRNRTPDALPAAERLPLLAACDRALRRTVAVLKPRYVVGVGKFAATRALQALAGLPVVIGRLTHPSPANPAANRGWGALAARELADLGISLETP
jgi:single-strand selective monofunctional uracil DNA glycosylase